MSKKCYEKLILSLYMLFIFFFGCLILYLLSNNVKNDLFPNHITIFIGVISIVFPILYFIVVLIEIFNSIRNRSKHKNSTKNNNPISTTVQSKTESVTYSTHSQQNTTSEQFDVKLTKQYPVLHDIQNIISNLSKLERDNDLDKKMFVKFQALKDQYDVDYQKTIKILNKLKTIDQFDETHLTIFNHYLDLFKNEQNTIYEKIKQQYNDELNIIDDKLHHFNEMIDKTL